MASTSGRTARVNARISPENKRKLLHHKGDMSEAAFLDKILTLYFDPFKNPETDRVARVRKTTESR